MWRRGLQTPTWRGLKTAPHSAVGLATVVINAVLARRGYASRARQGRRRHDVASGSSDPDVARSKDRAPPRGGLATVVINAVLARRGYAWRAGGDGGGTMWRRGLQ